MNTTKILHILAPDKFTIPFIHLVNKEFNKENHVFLCSEKPDDALLAAYKNVIYLRANYRNNFYINTKIFYNSCKNSSKVILHGNPILFYLVLFPSLLKKTYWFIYGYELENDKSRNKSVREQIQYLIKKIVLKRVFGHLTHIRGDSERANSLFKSSAKFFYCPGYPSNVVKKYPLWKIEKNERRMVRKILAGNSTSPTNNHISLLNMILPYKEEDILIYCPLSYGIYKEYRDRIIEAGKDMFRQKFIPITTFMTPEEYNSFLEEMDIAVFNHHRQEAMGVTLSLLSMGKTVYLNSHTTSFRSLTERGFQVFDNKLIEKEGLFIKRNVSLNPGLAYENYSYERLIDSLAGIFNY